MVGVMTQVPFKRVVLPNGLTVVLQKTPTKTIAGRLRIKHGAVHEKNGEEGIAHFLEHALMGGGTKKYSPEAVDRIRDSFGLLNASTSLTKTEFRAVILPEDLECCLDLVSDIAFFPRFDKHRFEEEKQRVLRELADAYSRPSYNDEDRFYNLLFSGSTSHTKSVLGNKGVIEKLTSDHAQMFHSRGYCPNNADLILVGDLPKNTLDLVRRCFASLPRGKVKKYVFPKVPTLKKPVWLHVPAPDKINFHHRDESSALFMLAVIVPPFPSKQSETVRMLSSLLHAKLFRKVSQRMGLAYDISTVYGGRLTNADTLRIIGDVKASRLQEAVDAIFSTMHELREAIVQKEEIDRMKRVARFSSASVYDSNQGHIDSITMFLDHSISYGQTISRTEKITSLDIQKAAKSFIPESKKRGAFAVLLRNPLFNEKSHSVENRKNAATPVRL